MPALVAFSRKWNLGSDDFVFPALTEAIVRLLWLSFALAVFIYNYEQLKCTFTDVTVPIAILLCVNAITIFHAFTLAGFSAQGTIMNGRKRRHVSTLLYLRLPILVVELIWTIYSTIAVFESYVDRSNKTLNSPFPIMSEFYNKFQEDRSCQFSTIIKVSILLEWMLFFVALIGIIVVFHPASEEDVEDMNVISRKIWSRRFRLFKIRQDELMRAALDDLANLFASFFSNGELVFSDIVAGLLLVVHSPSNVYPPLISCPSARPDWMTQKNALHYFSYASGIYGWMNYVFQNCSLSSCCKLLGNLHCCGQLQCDQRPTRGKGDEKSRLVEMRFNGRKVLIVEDNCCFCNTAAFLLDTNETRNNTDLFYISFHNRLYKVPFAVLVDHKMKSIVLAIRGSCSTSDLMTDLCLKEEILSEDVNTDPTLRNDPSLENAVRVHKGMLNSARYIFETLRSKRILEDLFLLNPQYNLVICGHSLGAGIASLLTLFLKQKHPNVQCYAYAPPGCVVSEEGEAEMSEHVFSVVCGDDVVSRISYHSMYQVKKKVEQELSVCSTPKYEILIKGVFRLFWKTPWEDSPLSGNGTENTDRSELMDSVNSDRSEYGATISTSLRPDDDRVKLFVPGKVLYIAMDGETAVKEWIDPKCLSDIKLSASALADHLPKNIIKILKALVDEESSHSISIV